jgi:peptide/nickel transport system substrate-binding protein
MDINRTQSCTIFMTMLVTNNRLARMKVGAHGHPHIPEIEPDLAQSWEASPDGAEFTFHLHEGIKTHNVDPTNGRVYTSEDVKLSMERYQAGGAQKDVFAPITAIETPDENTVKVTLDQPIADFPTTLASWGFMWVKELIENEELLDQKAIGTGPFVQEEWTPKERSVFSKHPDYFEEGLPFLDRLVYVVQADTAAARAAFLTDNFAYDSFRDDTDGQDLMARSDDAVLYRYPISRGANVNGWHFQIENPVFQDERVRRAISLAFDRTDFDLAFNAGDNQAPGGAFSLPPMPWAFLFDEYPTAEANGPWYQYDPEQASQLLQAAGYSATNKLNWEHVTWYDRQSSSEVVIPGIMASVPEVNISFRQVDNPTQVTLLSDRNFNESIGIVWGPPGYAMDQWIYPWYHTGGGLNYNNKGNPALDELLVRQRAEPDIEAKKEIWTQVWDTIHDQVWDIWWPQAHGRTAWHNYVMNWRAGGFSTSCYNNNQDAAVWLDEGSRMREG